MLSDVFAKLFGALLTCAIVGIPLVLIIGMIIEIWGGK